MPATARLSDRQLACVVKDEDSTRSWQARHLNVCRCSNSVSRSNMRSGSGGYTRLSLQCENSVGVFGPIYGEDTSFPLQTENSVTVFWPIYGGDTRLSLRCENSVGVFGSIYGGIRDSRCRVLCKLYRVWSRFNREDFTNLLKLFTVKKMLKLKKLYCYIRK